MVLITKQIIQIKFNQDAPKDAWGIINQTLQSLTSGWQVVDHSLEALPGTSSVDACMMAMNLAERIDWFASCVESMDLLRVAEVSDLTRLFNRPQWTKEK